MKLPLNRLGVLVVAAGLGILGCEYGRGGVRKAGADVADDDYHAGIPKGSHSGGSIMPGTFSKQARDIEQSLDR